MAVGGFRACGVRVDALNLDQATETVLGAAVRRQPLAAHLCNAYTLALSVREPTYAAVVDQGDLNLMDGTPLVWTARRLGFHHCTERVYGPDLMVDVLDRGRAHAVTHFLYGGTPEGVGRLQERLLDRFPGLQIAGTMSPPFRDLTPGEEEEVERQIIESDADVVWVGLGTPAQDWFVHRFRDRLGRPLIAVGAAFDFHAGLKRQAPRALQRAGLEWAFRLAMEPRRLWRRYVIGIPVFLFGLTRGIERLETTREWHP